MREEAYNRALEARCARTTSPLVEAGGAAAVIPTKKGSAGTVSSLGMCGQRSAIAGMPANGEGEIAGAVAAMPHGTVGSPCGARRELMMRLCGGSGEAGIPLEYPAVRTAT